MIAVVTAHGVVVNLHQGFARVVLIYSLLLALWGLFLFFRGSNPSGGYLGALVINEGVAVLQSLIGLVLIGQGHRPDDPLHYLYGVVLVLTLPAAYYYSGLTGGGSDRRDSLVFALAGLFLFAIGIRATTTGAGAT
jgi:hypothetical protein